LGTLEVRELTVRAGRARLRAADLAVRSGEVVAVVGDAGVRLLVRAAAGVLAPAAGAVRVDGEDTAPASAADLAARGVVLVPAGWRPFADLTLFENLRVGARGDAPVAHGVLGRLRLPSDKAARGLDDGAARTLAVGVGLARRPRLLLVEGLRGADPARVLGAVRAAAGEGLAAVVAERVAFEGRDPVLPPGLDPAAFDRVLVVRGGRLRPWPPV
jgi:ABC-type branched-subunit amino acid transport system ATPase component